MTDLKTIKTRISTAHLKEPVEIKNQVEHISNFFSQKAKSKLILVDFEKTKVKLTYKFYYHGRGIYNHLDSIGWSFSTEPNSSGTAYTKTVTFLLTKED